MIVKQLSRLFCIDNVFIYKNRLYESISEYSWSEHKYRVIFCEDDYDYVEDEELIRELDNKVKQM